MTINIDDKHRVVSDPMNWSLEELAIAGEDAKEPGKETWKNLGYYRNFPQCVNALHARNISLIKGSNADKILQAIKESEQTILAALERVAVTK